MTFEYRDADGDCLTFTVTTDDQPHILVHAAGRRGVMVHPDRVEEVVAGIRDTARTASGQQAETKPAYYGVNGCTCRAWTGDGGVPRFLRGDESVELISGWEEQPDCPHHAPAVNGQKPETTPCGSRSLPTYSGEVVSCVLKTGHAAQCQSAVEWPYVSWPNPSNGEGWRTAGQPAEAQAADSSLTATERKFLHFALDEAAEEMSYGDGFTDEDQAALDRLRLLAGKDER
ncbi:hypothetical protein ACFTWD_09390 [Streptomyces sp. NPDC056943]|uniref:hypothetical protein n=1 Tax=Streptomyces sp. NPDC056943 TaxID=3345971 RepID=UPI003628660E